MSDSPALALALTIAQLLRRAALLCLGLLWAAPETARAEDERNPFRVEYAAGSECVDPEGFSERLLRRTQRLRSAETDEPALGFYLEIHADAATFAGQLLVREAEGAETRRHVTGASCDEVLSAMVLIAAVLVDPNASLVEDAPSGEQASAGAQGSPASPPASPTATAAPPPPPPPAPAPAPRPPPQPPAPSPGREPRFTSGGGAALGFEGAVAPGLVPSVAFELALGVDLGGLWSPLLGLGVARSFPARTETTGSTARFRYAAFRAGACPLRFPSRGRWALRPCGTLELGEIRASGEDTLGPAVANAPWTALGAQLRAEYQPFVPLLLFGGIGPIAPLRRHKFYFDPESTENTVFTVPALGLSGWIGVAGRL